MDKDEFVAYKKARLDEISRVIKASGDSIEPHSMELDEIQERLEKLKSEHPWLR